ncbi:cell division protein FtsZ, partial [Pseudoalteromonas fenneropenaei]
VNFYCINTDKVVLNHTQSDESVLIGEQLTHGYGAGADPAVGLLAAQESEAQLIGLIQKCDILLCAAGFGGGTGTGASPYIAKLAREHSKPVIGIATLPFSSEGEFRRQIAQEGLDEFKQYANAVVTLPNDKLIEVLGSDVGLFDAFKHSNQLLHSLIVALIDMLCHQGLINIDLKDFVRVMDAKGDAVLCVGKCNEESDLQRTLEQTLTNPLISSVDMSTSTGAIIQINCKEEISLGSYDLISSTVCQKVSPSALIICGVSKLEKLQSNYEILVIATGAKPNSYLQDDEKDGATEQRAIQKQQKKDDILDIPTFFRKQSPAPTSK